MGLPGLGVTAGGQPFIESSKLSNLVDQRASHATDGSRSAQAGPERREREINRASGRFAKLNETAHHLSETIRHIGEISADWCEIEQEWARSG